MLLHTGDLIYVLGCESPLCIRPQPSEIFQVLSECFVSGLNDANAFLGPLPPHCMAHVFNTETGLFTIFRLHNIETNTTPVEDPRLDPLSSK